MSFIKRSPLFAKHLEARRASARKSTGPHTPAGKERQELEIWTRDLKLRTRPVPDSGVDRDENKPNGLNIRPVNQMGGFEPKQTQDAYLACFQLDTAKFGPLFDKYECGKQTQEA